MSNPASRGELFQNPDFDEKQFNSTINKLTLPHGTFGIFFTPRSGSSWLTDVLTPTRLLGKPQEWFYDPKRKNTNNGMMSPLEHENRKRKQKMAGV